MEEQKQFGIVAIFLLVIIMINHFKRKHQLAKRFPQHVQMQRLAALLVNRDQQKRDGISWFIILASTLFYISLFSLVLGSVSVYYNFKSMLKPLEIFGLNKKNCGITLAAATVFFGVVAVLLIKTYRYYDNKLTKAREGKPVELTDQQKQELSDIQAQLSNKIQPNDSQEAFPTASNAKSTFVSAESYPKEPKSKHE